jgi:hypothetical protein
MNSPADLFAALGDIPRLPSAAACVGRHELFDLRDLDDPLRPQIEAEAVLVCETVCPSATAAACADWLDSTPPSRRPEGVVAARVVRPPAPARPRGRPPKATL